MNCFDDTCLNNNNNLPYDEKITDLILKDVYKRQRMSRVKDVSNENNVIIKR